MILVFNNSFLGRHTDVELCDITTAIARNGHYISCSREMGKMMRKAVKDHAGTSDKTSFASGAGFFDYPDHLEKIVRKFEVPDNINAATLIHFISDPSRLVMENGHNEWSVYSHIIDIFEKDAVYGDYYKILKTAKDKGRIHEAHAGGRDGLIKEAESRPIYHDGENLRLRKTCVLFDRDTDNNTDFSGYNNTLFKRLCSKDYTTVTDRDIYTLRHDSPQWHMWYKRAIENYFPVSQYDAMGCDTSNISGLTREQRSYFKIEGKKNSVPKYAKGEINKLVKGLSKSALLAELDRLDVDGTTMSEMHLFLLKLVKTL